MIERGRRAAQVAWIAPTAGVAVVGLVDGLAPRATWMIGVLVAAVAVGVTASIVALLSGGRRRALAGLVVNGVIVVGALVALAAGAHDRGRRAADAAKLRAQGAAAAAEYPGWYGNAGDGRVRLFALELDAASELARKIGESFDQPIGLLMVGVDNRAGDHEVVLDLTEIRLVERDGSTRVPPPRAQLLSHARSAELRAFHGGVYRVAPGAVQKNALAFVAAGESLRDVTALAVVLDGKSVMIRGRYYSVEEKRARAAHH